MNDPATVLTPLFFQAANKIAQRHNLLLCFENYEVTRSYLDGWLAKLPQYQPSTNIRLVIASRTVPGPAWHDLQAVVQHFPLDLFTTQEAEEYLDLQAIDDLQRRQEIIDFSGRLPILMSWLAAPDADAPDEALPTAGVVDRFLRWVTDVDLRRTALALSAPRYVNLDLV
ncbi:MAG: hypothetical protein GWN58_21010, partial [Anaerolineae bacterium]|nr:hypothetical protein [Anaerolineae bacterium]